MGADYARRTGLALRAVHVLSWPLGATAPGYDGKEAMRHPSFEEVDAIYRASITAVFDELDHPRPDWLIQFARGDAGPVLVRQSQKASLLVIGTPEHVGPGILIAGSVDTTALAVRPAHSSRFPLPPGPRPTLRRRQHSNPLRIEPAMSTGVVKQPSHLCDIPRDECEALLAAQRIGRVASNAPDGPRPPCLLWRHCVPYLAARCARAAGQPHHRRFRNRRHRPSPQSRMERSGEWRGGQRRHTSWSGYGPSPASYLGLRASETCGLAFRSGRSADDRSWLRLSTNPPVEEFSNQQPVLAYTEQRYSRSGDFALNAACGLNGTLCSDRLGCPRCG
jgi:hypothetical protein